MKNLPDPQIGPIEWLVLFQGVTAKRSWLLDRLEPGFHHVSLLRLLPEHDFWLSVDPTGQRLDVDVIDDAAAAERLAVTRQAPQGAVLRFWTAEQARMPWPVLSCVSICAAILGLPRCPLTPFRLYNDLLSRGALRLAPTRSGPTRSGEERAR